MKEDALRQELLAELRAFRRAQGAFGLERLALAELLTELVGQGSVEQAYTMLLDVLNREGKDAEGDIRAFFETAGLDTAGNNLDERLKTYAAVHFVDERTGLRRSDRGAERLSYILRDELNYERPWCNLIAVQDGNFAVVDVSIEIPEHTQWRRPHVYINDVFQERRGFELRDSETHPMLVTGQERFATIELNVEADEDTALLEVRVVWVMPVWPVWQSGAHLADPRLYTKLVNNRDHSAELSIHWANAAAAASRGRPLVRQTNEWPGI